MRLHISDLSRPKAVAKFLSHLSPEVTLSRAQEALARALRYREWHDLIASAGGPPSAPIAFEPDEAKRVILSLAADLKLLDGDVQFSISRARLWQEERWSSQQHQSLRTAIWREHVFGPPAGGKPGTIVKVKAHGTTRYAYLQAVGRPTYVLYDTGPGICGDFEAVTPREALPDFIPSRLWLPYGVWTLRDGSEVIFARDYLPMWHVAGDVVERVDPWLWINDIVAEKNFSAAAGTVAWSRGRAREMALRHLEERRITALPSLVDAMPYLLRVDGTVGKGVRELRLRSGKNRKLPSYGTQRSRFSSPEEAEELA